MLRILVDRRGSVSTIAAFCIGVMIALAGLVVHGSQLYVLKIREQRTADLAVQAAAGVAGPISGSVPSAAAVAVAQNIAEVNGFSPSSTALSVTNGNKLQVDLSKSYSTLFGATSTRNASVNSTAVAKPAVTAPPCVIAVSSAVNIVQQSALKASCGVIAARNLTVDNASLNASSAAVGFTRIQEEAEIRAAVSLSPALSDFAFSNTASDPLAGDVRIARLDAKLDQMASGWPYASRLPVMLMTPTVQSGQDLIIDGNVSAIRAGARIGNLTVAGSTARFLGNGPDPNCTRPTTVSGTTRLSRGATLVFNSGCYVFQGDVSQEDQSASYAILADSADVKIVVLGTIINKDKGTLGFPKGAYSITGGLTNLVGGRLEFGDGPKVIGGTIDNGHSIMNLGGGPLYLQNVIMRQATGTITIGEGPTYIYNSSVTNGVAGTLNVGVGPIYIAGSTLENGDSDSVVPTVNFEAGPYYMVAATVNNNGRSNMVFGNGNMELYQTSFTVKGGTFSYGLAGSTASGQLSMVGSTFAQNGGAVWLRGVTIAATRSPVWFAGDTLEAIAPSGGAPAFGVRNLLVYSRSNGAAFNIASGAQQVSGVVYTPKGIVDFLGASYAPPEGCLAIAAASVNLIRGATVSASPCSDFPWPAAKPGPSKLVY